MMKSNVTDEYITKEFNKTSRDEWNEMCIQIDGIMKKYNKPINDLRWNKMIETFINVATANQVDETVLYVAYMQWLSEK